LITDGRFTGMRDDGIVRRMLGTHHRPAERTSRHAHKPLPTEEELRGMAALAISRIPMHARKEHRYGMLAGRLCVLRELGRVAESHGDHAARMIADHIVEGLADGSLCGSKHARYKVRELVHRLRDIAEINGAVQ
jgi:hypothetical protein